MPKHIFEFKLRAHIPLRDIESIHVKLETPETTLTREDATTKIIRQIYKERPGYNNCRYGYLPYTEPDRVCVSQGFDIITEIVVANFQNCVPDNYEFIPALLDVINSALSTHHRSKAVVLDWELIEKPVKEPILFAAHRMGKAECITPNGAHYKEDIRLLDLVEIERARKTIG